MKTASEIEAFIFAGVPCSGTNWITSIISDLGFTVNTRNKADLDSNQTHNLLINNFLNLSNGNFWSEHLSYDLLKDFFIKKKIAPKVILLARDPRDAIICTYLHKSWIDIKRAFPFEKNFNMVLSSVIVTFTGYCYNWIENYENLLVTTFENFSLNPISELKKVIDFLELNPKTDDELFKIINKHKPGIIGRWKHWFNDEILDSYVNELGHIHKKLGYICEWENVNFKFEEYQEQLFVDKLPNSDQREFNYLKNDLENLGILYLESFNYIKSEKVYKKLCFLFEDYNYFYYLGFSQMKLEKYEYAINTFAESIELGNCTFDLFNNLAICLEKTGDKETSELYYKKANELKV